MVEPQTHHSTKIFINGVATRSQADAVTPAELRRLAQPPIPQDEKMWLDIPDAPDEPLREEEVVHLVPDMRFFSQPQQICIVIDRVRYEVTHRRMTGSQLRAVPTPPVPADRDLWLDRPDEQDKKIADDEVVRLYDGIRFFTAPGRINPGAR
ncbi:MULTISPECIES: multiubiquitin domain-containing protein [Streptacidiphilus]|uniref:Multiubiquitin domain-containing protein n=1 Tax=Streptacidiphilus cavernicola TaxID=3342716 RepID=A0ABV6UU49_9ACTN|nr:multiubiquitin domain-containing protein [Streptacidiphilus jeojiense]